MKNTLLTKNIFSIQKLKYNKDKYGLISKLTVPIRPIIDTIILGVVASNGGWYLFRGQSEDSEYEEKTPSQILLGIFFGILLTSLGMCSGFAEGFKNQENIMKEIMKLNEKENQFGNEFKGKVSEKENKNLIIET